MKKIRLVYLVNFDLGVKIHLANQLRYQMEQGYDVTIICHPGRWLTHDTTLPNGVFVKVIPFYPSISPLADLKTLWRLVVYLRQERFDIVHTSTIKPGLLGRLAARLVGAPIVVHTLRGLYLHDQMSPAQRRFFILLEKIGSANCDSILSQNLEDIETMRREKICPPGKIRHLGNGIDLSRFYPGCVPAERVAALRTELGLEPDMPAVAYISRLVREKGFLEFLDAARSLKAQGVRARYLAVGAGQQDKRSSITPDGLVRERGLEDDVKLLGHRDDIPELLSLMAVLVLPSYAEGIPRIVMEAAAVGKPVVATRARGTLEIVDDGRTGLLVPVRDAPALAEAIHKILSDPLAAAERGGRARAHAVAHFDERQYIWKTDAEYRRLLQSKLRIDPSALLKPIPAAL